MEKKQQGVWRLIGDMTVLVLDVEDFLQSLTRKPRVMKFVALQLLGMVIHTISHSVTITVYTVCSQSCVVVMVYNM